VFLLQAENIETVKVSRVKYPAAGCSPGFEDPEEPKSLFGRSTDAFRLSSKTVFLALTLFDV
jgi:hypothetical protein